MGAEIDEPVQELRFEKLGSECKAGSSRKSSEFGPQSRASLENTADDPVVLDFLQEVLKLGWFFGRKRTGLLIPKSLNFLRPGYLGMRCNCNKE